MSDLGENNFCREAVAYWLLARFDMEFIESYSEDSGASKLSPLPQYHRARDAYLVQYVGRIKGGGGYSAGADKLNNYYRFLEFLMKGTSDRWKKEILNFKPLD